MNASLQPLVPPARRRYNEHLPQQARQPANTTSAARRRKELVMRKLIQIGKLLFVTGVIAVAGIGISSAQARPPCFCPEIWLPVICSNGMIYSNSCFAGCAGATGCVPFDFTQ
jgi:hypothetical protein